LSPIRAPILQASNAIRCRIHPSEDAARAQHHSHTGIPLRGVDTVLSTISSAGH